MNEGNKNKITAGILGLVLLLSALITVKLYSDSKGYKKRAEAEQLRQDSLMGTKQLLDKEIFELQGKNTELTNKIVSVNDLLSKADITLKQKDKDIAGITAKISKLKSSEKQLAESKNTIAELEKKLSAMLAEKNQWLIEKEVLNQAIADLKIKLAEKHEMPARAENLRIEVLKRNPAKLTVKARQSRSILISFNIDAKNKTSKSLSNIYVTITTPGGNPVPGKDNKRIVIAHNGQPQEITAVKTQPVDFTKTQRIAIPVEIIEKIKETGIYKIELFTDEGLFGNAEFRLM